MLITNFAAGELSKTLFGRTDLPQYYRGAARMENFDVIPTGGIRRRSGTERLAKLDKGGGTERLAKLDKGGGRIIPFIVNRDLGFLLYLTPLEITVYKLVKGKIPADEKPWVFASSYEAGEIGDVQYAQNYNTMILCHEKHPPLEVKLVDDELVIRQLEISFKKSVVPKEGVEENAFAYEKDDETYDSGRLTQEEHYPTAVCFYNGRLVFAATKKEHQRLFISAIKESDKPYVFATKKVFIEQKKEYIVIKGSVDVEEKNKIFINIEEGLKFTQALENYYIDSPFYSKDTRVFSLQGDVLTLTGYGNLTFLSQAIKDELQNLVQNAQNRDTLPQSAEREVASYSVYITSNPINGNPQYETQHLYITPGATKIKIRRYTEHVTDNLFFNTSREYSLDFNAVSLYENNNSYYADFVYSKFGSGVVLNQNVVNAVIQTLTNNSLATMKYNLAIDGIERTYYNFPWEIKIIIEGRLINANNIYIPFYTREIIADEYPTPDCGFTFEIASDANDAIRWLAVNKGLIVGTETGEWIIPPDVHATNIQAKLNSRYGSDKIQGTAVGDATVFFQAGKKGLVEYYIPQQDSNFRANNMAMLCPEMLNESDAAEFDYIGSPHAKLLITRRDWTMATLLYERGTGTFAWGRITTKGQIRSAAVLPGPDGNDDAYLLVERGGDFYLEKLQEAGGVYLDSWTKADETTWAAARGLYAGDGVAACRIYTDGEGAVRHEALDAGAQPDFAKGGDFYVGYAYGSVVRTMPVISNTEMKKTNIVNLIFRFLESYGLRMTSIANGQVRETNPIRDFEGPYTGIRKAAFPGTWAEDAQAELSADGPAPVTVLAVNAETMKPMAGA